MKNQQIKCAYALSGPIRTSTTKASLVLNMIRSMDISTAIEQLKFCKKKVAKEISVLLNSAISNAEYINLDVNSLRIMHAVVNKHMVMKRFRAKCKGKAGRILKYFCKIKIGVGYTI